MTRVEAMAHLLEAKARLYKSTSYSASEYAWVHRHEIEGCDCDVAALMEGNDPAHYECPACWTELSEARDSDARQPDRTDPGYQLDNY